MEYHKPGPIAPARTRPLPRGLRHLFAALALILAVTTGAARFAPRPSLRDGVPQSVEAREDDGRLALAPAADGAYRVWRSLGEISPLLAQATALELGPGPRLRNNLAERVAALRYGSGPARRLRALWLRWAFNRDELLEAYLNLAPYGTQISGAEAASFVYFDKHADQLTLSEALTLCVMPERPLRETLTGVNRSDQTARQAARRRLRLKLDREKTRNGGETPLQIGVL